MTEKTCRGVLASILIGVLGILPGLAGTRAHAQELSGAGGGAYAAQPEPIGSPFGSLASRESSDAGEKPAEAAPSAAPSAAPAPSQPAAQPPRRAPSTAPAAVSVGLASTDSPDGYLVGPGDVLQVTVWREPDASGEFKVGPDGTIHHYLVGDVGVAGHSVEKIAEVLRNALAMGYIRDPRVSVQVVNYQSQKVFVHGEVVRPGVYALRGPTDLLKLLLDAGGPTRDAGSECTLLQIDHRGDSEQVHSVTIALNDLLVKGDLSQNRKVSNGDVIYVHPREESDKGSFTEDDRSYFVLGEVKNPGAYKYKEGISAMTAILEAGGFSDYARSNKTKLVREKNGHKEERTVKMGDLMEKGDRSLDVDLLPGDVIVVPKSFF